MDETILRIILIALFTWSVCSTITLAILWSRVKGAELFLHKALRDQRDDLDKIQGKVPEARLLDMEAANEAVVRSLDTWRIDNQAFREAVHKSMQRFNSIMRRNETAILGKAEKALTDPNGSDTPDEIPLGDVRPPEHQGKPSRAELRALLRAKQQ